MPAVATTKVCPSASTIRMAADVSIDFDVAQAQKDRIEHLEHDRQHDQGNRRSPRRQVGGVKNFPPYRPLGFGWVAAFGAQRLGVCSRHLTSSANGSSYGAAGLGAEDSAASTLSLVTTCTGALTVAGNDFPAMAAWQASTPIAPIT